MHVREDGPIHDRDIRILHQPILYQSIMGLNEGQSTPVEIPRDSDKRFQFMQNLMAAGTIVRVRSRDAHIECDATGRIVEVGYHSGLFPAIVLGPDSTGTAPITFMADPKPIILFSEIEKMEIVDPSSFKPAESGSIVKSARAAYAIVTSITQKES